MDPFTSRTNESVRSLGEAELIRRLHKRLSPVCPPPPEGIGDDAAVIPFPAGEQLMLTTDPIVLGRHFDRKTRPEDAAAKLVKRNISDIAAMGGAPLAGVLSLFLPSSTSIAWLDRFYSGLCTACRQYGVSLNGGDICETDNFLAASLTLSGVTRNGRVVTRSGGGEGNRIYVTGTLGGSLQGRHLTFEPRVAEGAWLADRPDVTAMMDVSDGVAKDLPALVPTRCQAVVSVPDLPLDPAATIQAAKSGRSAAEHALTDGEDYELLFLLDKKTDTTRFEQEWRERFSVQLSSIGTLRRLQDPSSPPIAWQGTGSETLSAIHGYEHFR